MTVRVISTKYGAAAGKLGGKPPRFAAFQVIRVSMKWDNAPYHARPMAAREGRWEISPAAPGFQITPNDRNYITSRNCNNVDTTGHWKFGHTIIELCPVLSWRSNGMYGATRGTVNLRLDDEHSLPGGSAP